MNICYSYKFSFRVAWGVCFLVPFIFFKQKSKSFQLDIEKGNINLCPCQNQYTTYSFSVMCVPDSSFSFCFFLFPSFYVSLSLSFLCLSSLIFDIFLICISVSMSIYYSIFLSSFVSLYVFSSYSFSMLSLSFFFLVSLLSISVYITHLRLYLRLLVTYSYILFDIVSCVHVSSLLFLSP